MSEYELARQIAGYLTSVHGLHGHVTARYGESAELKVYKRYEYGVYDGHVYTIQVGEVAP